MNLLSDPTLPDIQPNLFELGATIESKTRGVWGYVVPHDTDPANKAVLLLDFEGMYDPSGQRRNPNFDAQIFLLAVLVSSSFIYNTAEQIQAKNLSDFYFIANLGRHMKLRSSAGNVGGLIGALKSVFTSPAVPANPDDNLCHFPNQFTWAVRDFFLQYPEDVKTDNQYLEKMLQPQGSSTNDDDKANSTRRSVKKYFPNRSCFTLVRPVVDERALQRVETLRLSELRPEFIAKIRPLVAHIYGTLESKKITNNGTQAACTGVEFVEYFEQLLQQLNENGMFCVEDASTTMFQKVTQRLFQQCKDSFEQQFYEIFRSKELPMELSTLEQLVAHVRDPCVEVYVARAQLLEDENYGITALDKALTAIVEKATKVNYEASTKKVAEIISTCMKELKSMLSKGEIAIEKGNRTAFYQVKNDLFEAVLAWKGNLTHLEYPSFFPFTLILSPTSYYDIYINRQSGTSMGYHVLSPCDAT